MEPAAREIGERRIIHVDMDAFYASVEVRDNPALKGQPVVVGGSPQSRGVVAAASYEARTYGVRSAMPCARAYRLCPHAVFIPPDFARYRAVSERIHGIFARYTPLIEPLSLDEAYLDVTEHRGGLPTATAVAKAIREAIHAELHLTASAGVAPNKFLAKIASEERKPDGLYVITPDRVAAFVQDLSLAKVPGVGRATLQQLEALGLKTCGDLQGVGLAELVHRFGRRGQWFHQIARGIDPRPVEPHRERKSVGIEDTFARDIADAAWLHDKLRELCEGLAKRTRAAGVRGRTLTLKLRLGDFRTFTRSRTLPAPLDDAPSLLAEAWTLYEASGFAGEPLRLLGVSLSHLDNEAPDPQAEAQLVLPLDGAVGA